MNPSSPTTNTSLTDSDKAATDDVIFTVGFVEIREVSVAGSIIEKGEIKEETGEEKRLEKKRAEESTGGWW